MQRAENLQRSIIIYLLRIAADLAQKKKMEMRRRRTLEMSDNNVYPDFSKTSQANRATNNIPIVRFFCLHKTTSATVKQKKKQELETQNY